MDQNVGAGHGAFDAVSNLGSQMWSHLTGDCGLFESISWGSEFSSLNPFDWSSKTWGTIGLVVGGVALAATGVGLAADAGLLAGLGISAETVGTVSEASAAVATDVGAGSVAIDAAQCLTGVSKAACFGVVTGGASVVYGVAANEATNLGLRVFIGSHAAVVGGAGWIGDLLGSIFEMDDKTR